MRTRGLIAVAAAWFLGIVLASERPPHASAAVAPDDRLELGVTTHFGQGWPESYWNLLDQSGVTLVRDSIAWRLIESEPGRYNFTAQNSGHLDRLCQRGYRLVLSLLPRHPAYDGGLTVTSAAGRAAYAAYLRAVADRYPNCLAAIEIDNEINVKNNVTGPAANDRQGSHLAILRDAYAALRPSHPEVALLGGSSNAVATGFLSRLLTFGGPQWLDGIAVHPYRPDPAGLDNELQRLDAKIAASGAESPLWATEFTADVADRAAAPGILAKTVTMMSASGMRRALWYALVDQPGFPNMGLFARDGSFKPVGEAFAYLSRDVLSHGRAVRQNTGEPALHQYQFGSDRTILWGARRPLNVTGNAQFRDASGRAISKPAYIDDEPVIIEGNVTIRLGPASVLADSLYDFGRAPWRYSGQLAANPRVPFDYVDWNWNSFIGHPALKPVTVNPLGLVPGGTAAQPRKAFISYAAPAARRVFASACIRKKQPGGDGVSFTIAANGGPVYERLVTAQPVEVNVPLNLASGSSVEFGFGPNQTPAADFVYYRLRVATEADAAVKC